MRNIFNCNYRNRFSHYLICFNLYSSVKWFERNTLQIGTDNQIKDLCFSLPTNKTHYSKYCKYAINVKIHSLYLCLRRISNDNYLCNRSVWVCFYVNLFYRASVVKLISFWNLWLLPKRIICKTRRSKDSIPAPYDTLLYCYTFQMCDYHIREEICQLFTFA